MRYFEQRKARIEIIPMIDIMFFLLVFFIMITLRMIPATGISSQLPQSSTAQSLPHPKLLIVLQADGQIQIQGQSVTLDALTSQLAAEPHPDKTVVTIAGAQSVSLQHLLAVMDACRKAGVTQISVAAKESH